MVQVGFVAIQDAKHNFVLGWWRRCRFAVLFALYFSDEAMRAETGVFRKILLLLLQGISPTEVPVNAR